MSGTARARTARRGGARAVGPRVTFAPATPDRWPDVERLFGPRGACAGRWCMYPRVRGRAFALATGDGNRRALQRIVRSGEEPGVIAYVDGAPAGWCALAPRERYPRIVHSRLLAPVDDQPVWSVVCFFVAREHRGSGLTVELLGAAADHARRHGATMLEGYPNVPRPGSRLPDAFAWFGTLATFRSAGFTEVAAPSPARRIMRLDLGGRRGARASTRSRTSRPRRAPRG